MLQIDYNDVSKNIVDYVISYTIETVAGEMITIYNVTEEGTHGSQTKPTEMLRKRNQRYDFREISFWTIKCISIDIPFMKNQKVLRASVKLKTDIFNGGVRPTYEADVVVNDAFIVSPHYSKQLSKAMLQGNYEWPIQSKNSNDHD